MHEFEDAGNERHWKLTYEQFNPESEQLREALCTLGNGYFCTRGAAPESSADQVHYPGTYLAGGYNRLTTEIAGRSVENEDLVNFPNWLLLTFRLDGGEWFDLRDVNLKEFRQTLDLQRGIWKRAVRFSDKHGRTTQLINQRFVHSRHPHLAGQKLTLEPEDWSGRVEFRSALDGRVQNRGVERYANLASKHHEPLFLEAIDEETVGLKVRTNQSRLEVAMCARTRVCERRDRVHPERSELRDSDGLIGQEFSVEVSEARPLVVEKLVSLYTSRDRGISECGLEARDRLESIDNFEAELDDHVETWQHLWHRFDIGMDVEDDGTSITVEDHPPDLVLRLHVFHLLQTASPHTMDLDTGVPARGWHGEAYRGHIFWDELFIFPMLNFRMPEITRSLLRYRYRRLDEARQAARQAGYCGAMFPWQSGSNGREESQTLHLNPRSGRWLPDHTHLQRHVSADIAYNVWQYYQMTDDLEFLNYRGAEIILEVARFWANIATIDHERERFEICGVMGPDEYHDAYPDRDEPGLDNNAYTNIMAVWVLEKGLEVLERLPAIRRNELRDRLDLTQDELDMWQEISSRMYVPFIGDDVLAQFEGYDQLEEFDWEGYREEYGDIQRLDRILEAEDDTPNNYKASKQADVLMLFYLFSTHEIRRLLDRLGYHVGPDVMEKNISYYLSRTSHGSTLSRIVHSYVTAECNRSKSWEMFTDALHSDVADIQGGTTGEGIHLGAMAGTVDLVQRVYAGLEIRSDEVLRINPSLPDELTRLHLDIRFRGHSLAVTITHDHLHVRDEAGPAAPITIGVAGATYELSTDETLELELG